MVIGHHRAFLFVHVPKCAGESISELLLAPANGGSQFLGKHATYAAARGALGDSIDRLESFAVVRNPYEQVLSFYEHLRKPLFVPPQDLERQYPGNGGRLHPHRACELAMRMDFPAYVREAYGGEVPVPRLFRDCCAWLTGPDPGIAVRRILRFERLGEEFGLLARELGLSGSLPHLNPCHGAADPRRYRDRYDDASRLIVERHFARTIHEFGYRF
jgi:hypothetical protein